MRQIGLDPKHLERRAAVLSEKEKAAYEAYVKRQEAKEAAEGGMEVDAGDVEMQDGESSARGVAARGPKSNRQLAGMATEAVRIQYQPFPFRIQVTDSFTFTASQQGGPAAKVCRPRTQQDGAGFGIRSSYPDYAAKVDVVRKAEAGHKLETLRRVSAHFWVILARVSRCPGFCRVW